MKDDRGIADALYTVLSAGIVVLAGLAIAAVVLGVAGQQGKAVADRLDGPGGAGLKKGLYAFYYTVDPSADYASADPGQVPPGDFIASRPEPSLALDKSGLPPGAPPSGGMAIWTGYLVVSGAGDYAFELESAGGSWLWVDGVLIADNHGAHPLKAVYSPTIHLNAGRHAVKARYFYTDADRAYCKVRINAGGTWSVPLFYR
jgi:hypothetical protein